MKPIPLTDQQLAMLQRLKAETARFNDLPELRSNSDAIESARTLINDGAEMGLPEVALIGLRTWVRLYDCDNA